MKKAVKLVKELEQFGLIEKVNAIASVLKEYSAKQMKKQEKKERPSILEKLKKFKDIVAKQPKKEKERRKEHER